MKQSGTRSGSKRGDGNRGLHDEGEKVHTSLQSPQKAPLAGRSQQNPPISLEKERARRPSRFPPPLSGEGGRTESWELSALAAPRPARRAREGRKRRQPLLTVTPGIFSAGRGEKGGAAPASDTAPPPARPGAQPERRDGAGQRSRNAAAALPPPPLAPRGERGRSAGPGAAMAGAPTSSRAPAPAAGAAVATGSAGGGGEGARRRKGGALPG